jgi:hypothetical protein
MSSNLSFNLRSILEKEKLNGTNFVDWNRNLRIVLRREKKILIRRACATQASNSHHPFLVLILSCSLIRKGTAVPGYLKKNQNNTARSIHFFPFSLRSTASRLLRDGGKSSIDAHRSLDFAHHQLGLVFLADVEEVVAQHISDLGLRAIGVRCPSLASTSASKGARALASLSPIQGPVLLLQS